MPKVECCWVLGVSEQLVPLPLRLYTAFGACSTQPWGVAGSSGVVSATFKHICHLRINLFACPCRALAV